MGDPCSGGTAFVVHPSPYGWLQVGFGLWEVLAGGGREERRVMLGTCSQDSSVGWRGTGGLMVAVPAPEGCSSFPFYTASPVRF